MSVILVIAGENLHGADAGAIGDVLLGKMTRKFPDAHKTKEPVDCNVDGHPGKRHFWAGTRANVKWRFDVVTMLRDQKEYVIQMMVPESYAVPAEPNFDQIVKSWKWIK